MDAAQGFDGVNVLIVDDNNDMRTLISRMLKRVKFGRVVEAAGGPQALEHLTTSAEPIGIVICDWNMPGMSGMDLFRQVHERNPRLPFLMLTGRADIDSVVAAKKAGVHGYLLKPISPQQLLAKIASLIGSGAAHTP